MSEDTKLSIANITIKFFQERKGYVMLYLFLILSYPLGSIVVPHYYGKLLELMAAQKEISKTFLTTLLLWIVAACGTFTLSRLDSSLIPKFRSYLYHKIAKYIFDIHKEDYTNIRIGELVSKLSKIPYLILEIFYQMRTCYIPLVYMIFFCLTYFFSINVRLGGLVLSVILAFGGVGLLSINNCMPSCVHAEATGDLANENLQDILDNILSVYSADNIDGEIKAFDMKNEELRKHMYKCLSCASKHKFAFSSLYIVSFVIVSTFAYKLYKDKSIGLSQISSVLIVLLYLLSQIDATMQYMQETISYIGSIIDIQNYINKLNLQYKNTTDNIDRLNMSHPLYEGDISDIAGSIQFRNIDICFGDKCIMKNFNYSIPAKEKVAVIGKIGSGKSSLLKMIIKLSYPSNGQILIDGKNLSYDRTRRLVSYIGQTPMLFNRTLLENIVYGTTKTKEDVIVLMQKYNLQSIFGNHKLDDVVGKGGNFLSGGQKQVVILLRTILRDTKIILLDEPTTALDTSNKNMIIDLIFMLFKDKTVLMITHDDEIVKRFDTVLNLDKPI